MKETKRLLFSIEDTVFDNDLSPTNVTLPMVSDFLKQITTFLKGSERPDLSKVKAKFEKGSLAVGIEYEEDILDSAYKVFVHLKTSKDLRHIDTARSAVIKKWQLEAQNNESRRYCLATPDSPINREIRVIIDEKTKFVDMEPLWAEEELYLYGHIYDIGGKNDPNVHIELENGKSLKVDTSKNFLLHDNKNRIYKNQLVRIVAKRNMDTNELKEERLISFEDYSPQFDEEEFEQVSKKARIAWKSVEDPVQWVEQLRNNNV